MIAVITLRRGIICTANRKDVQRTRKQMAPQRPPVEGGKAELGSRSPQWLGIAEEREKKCVAEKKDLNKHSENQFAIFFLFLLCPPA